MSRVKIVFILDIYLYMEKQYKLIHGDCIEEMKKMDSNSVDAIVCDPPYELGFMNKAWDKSGIANNVNVWKEALRILKPGGHMLAFSGTRTYHRMVCAIEDAGFEIRDQLAWVYSSGFPKSQNVGKKVNGYDGWGTALKPAQEPIVLARKPLSENTIVDNVKKYGTGAINIDDSRIKTQKGDEPSAGNRTATFGTQETISGGDGSGGWEANPKGRWPANLIHDGSEEVNELLPNNSARFFYYPKVNKKDRGNGNNHITVKPTELMKYLIRLITPPNGVVLDPFNGSGSTGKAAILLGYKYIGIDMTEEYIKISQSRLLAAEKEYNKEHSTDAYYDNV